MTEKIKVTIDRARWRTGKKSVNATGKGDTELLNSEGYMCCLGFCCQAAGVSAKLILGNATPSDLCKEFKESHQKIGSLVKEHQDSPSDLILNSDLARQAMWINDHADSTPALKEQKILELFKDSEFEIEFTGEYPIIANPDNDTSKENDTCAL
jgi:hypothetical protein